MENQIFYLVDNSHIPKLKSNFDEVEFHAEYLLRKEKAEQFLPDIHLLLRNSCVEDRGIRDSPKRLAVLYMIYKEMHIKGPWYYETLEELAEQLNHCMINSLTIDLNNILKNARLFATQEIYDECMKELHQKLTSSMFKKYPSLIEVYCRLIGEFQEYQGVVLDVKSMPITLYLMDDHNPTCKKKGLNCCINILKNLPEDSFADGNYSQVIYASLKNLITERDLELTKLMVKCFLLFFEVIRRNHDFQIREAHQPRSLEPSDVFQTRIADDLYTKVLYQLQTESNLHRKAELFRFMKHVVAMNKENCINKNAFHTVVRDSLEASTNEGVEEILLLPIVECLEEWIKYCWCIFKLKSGQDLQSTLLKVLYTCKDKYAIVRLCEIIGTLITFKEEKDRLTKILDQNLLTSERLNLRLQLLTKHVHI